MTFVIFHPENISDRRKTSRHVARRLFLDRRCVKNPSERNLTAMVIADFRTGGCNHFWEHRRHSFARDAELA
jgi:hypothetical protein